MRRTIGIAVGLLLVSSVAWARHPERYRDPGLLYLAHELEEAARHVYGEARARRHHYDREESYGLRTLRKLESRARHFHRQVERHDAVPYHTENDFLALREAYFRAAEAMRHLHGVAHVRRDLARVGGLMARLDRYFFPHAARGYDGYHHDPRHLGRASRTRPSIHGAPGWRYR